MGRTVRAMALGLVVCGAADARAAIWAVGGAGCAPSDATAGLYIVNNGAIGYRGTVNGPLTFYCPITTAPPACPGSYRLRLTYTDADGTSPLGSVAAQLFGLAQSDGGFAPVPGAQVSSNGSAATVPTSRTSPPFDHDFSELADYSFVRVTLSRAWLTIPLEVFHGVALECAE